MSSDHKRKGYVCKWMSGIREWSFIKYRKRENSIRKKSNKDYVGYELDLKGNIVSWKITSREMKLYWWTNQELYNLYNLLGSQEKELM